MATTMKNRVKSMSIEQANAELTKVIADLCNLYENGKENTKQYEKLNRYRQMLELKSMSEEPEHVEPMKPNTEFLNETLFPELDSTGNKELEIEIVRGYNEVLSVGSELPFFTADNECIKAPISYKSDKTIQVIFQGRRLNFNRETLENRGKKKLYTLFNRF